MLSGIQVLGSIDEVFGQARQQTLEADLKVSELNERLLRLRREESEAYQGLARIRLAAGSKDALIARLTSIDDNVRAVLGTRSSATASIDAEMARIEAVTARLQGEREKAAALVGERQQALIACEAGVRQRLEATSDYQRQKAKAEAAEGVAAQARQKTEQAETDREAKGKPYENDPLFQYLWRRGFGTTAYAGGPPARRLDRWVAGIVGFDKARADYAMLQEIPERLARHAERLTAQAADEAAKLTAMQHAALDEAEPATLRAELAKAQATVDALDDAIEANGKVHVEAIGRRALIVRGDDPQARGVMRVIEDALRDQDLQALRADAEATRTREDDDAVRRLEQIEEEETQVAAALKEATRAQDALRKQMTEIGSVRRDYRRRGYNRGMFDAASGAFIGSMLAELLRGGLSSDRFWDQVGSRQLPEPGSDGWGGGGGGGGSFGGDSGGGDFRTGGGF